MTIVRIAFAAALVAFAACALADAPQHDNPAAASQATSEPAVTQADAKTAQQFRDDCAAKTAQGEKNMPAPVLGKDGWMFFVPELRHVGAGQFWGDDAVKVSKASKPANADPLPVIVDFNDQLKGAGIELLFVPVPPKAVIYPETISDHVALGPDGVPPRVDLVHAEFIKLLRDKGVNTLDLAPALLAARAKGGAPLYCRQDTHWSPAACELTAKLIAAQLADRQWLKDAARIKVASKPAEIEITGDLWREVKDSPPAKEKLTARMVSEPMASDKQSPIVLLGDSHCLVFNVGDDMHCRGAGLADQLNVELGLPIDLMGVRGSGSTPSRVNFYRCSQSNPDYLKTKKLVIWCLSAREFTESINGWAKVPIAPK